MHHVRRTISAQRGLTLLEMAVVGAILSILAGLTAVAVTGSATSTSGAAILADVSEVQKAVENFSGQHPSGLYPTLNGCLPGQVKLPNGQCQHSADPGKMLPEDVATWAAIVWRKPMRTCDGKLLTLRDDFLLRAPSHGLEHTDGSGWTRAVPDPDGVTPSLLVPDHAGFNDPSSSSTRLPVWVMDKHGVVWVTLTVGEY
ncbi:MAG: prepilin-type N-terminal cleavage/methylation domain-containing protein [Dehalococcoidia bacterium]|nr:prepilin-type N-terminal cleavage/methylation domain-containing protein [Dehalococcoidia bacterium]